MAVTVMAEETVDFGSYVPTKISDEAKKLLQLYWIFDNWIDAVDSMDLQKMSARVLYLQFERLVLYYYEQGKRNKAKLALNLSGAMRYAEDIEFNTEQIHALQSLLFYFQRINLTLDELKQCYRHILQHGIFTTPSMPDWETAVLNH